MGSQWGADRFYRKSKREGYRSRAAYKILDIQNRFEIIRSDDNVVDLGAAPGSWSQVLRDMTDGQVIAVDIGESFTRPPIFVPILPRAPQIATLIIVLQDLFQSVKIIRSHLIERKSYRTARVTLETGCRLYGYRVGLDEERTAQRSKPVVRLPCAFDVAGFKLFIELNHKFRSDVRRYADYTLSSECKYRKGQTVIAGEQRKVKVLRAFDYPRHLLNIAARLFYGDDVGVLCKLDD